MIRHGVDSKVTPGKILADFSGKADSVRMAVVTAPALDAVGSDFIYRSILDDTNRSMLLAV